MSLWWRMLVRGVGRRRGQFAAVAATSLLGVALFVASYDAYQNLVASYAAVFDRTHFADLSVEGGDVNGFASDAAAVDGVAQVTQRNVVESYARVDTADGPHRILARVVGMPADHQPDIDQVLVLSGSYLSSGRANGVLLERHLADYYGLGAGDTLELRTPLGWEKVSVVGVAASAEYLWPARNRQDIFSLPDSFGVVFAGQAPLQLLAGGAGREALVTVAATAPREAVLSRLEALAREHGATSITPRAEQPSNAVLHEDITGFGEMALMFPALFLGAAGLAAFVIISRLVNAERTLIGTLRASGVGRRALLLHHLGFGLLPAGSGAVVGAFAGEGLALLVSRLYTQALSIPVTVIRPHPLVGAVGVVLALAAVAVGALAPALDAARVPPAEAMRGVRPVAGPRALTRARTGHARRASMLPASWKLVFRGALRNPGRSATTVAGVMLALILVLVSLGMLDTTKILLARQFQRVQQQDLEVYAVDAVGPDLQRKVAGVPGVASSEPVALTRATVRGPAGSYDTALRAFVPGTAMHAFLAPGGRNLALPDGGVLLAVALRRRLGVDVGDRVTLVLPDVGRTVETKVAGFVEEPLGSFVYASLPVATAEFGAKPNAIYLRLAPGADARAAQDALEAFGSVAAVVDARTLARAADRLMGLFYAFVGAMLAFGAALAFALIYSTMSVTISERSGELATLRAAGVRQGQIARIVSGENLLLVLAGLVPGMAAAYLAAGAFMASFSSDMFRFNLQVTPLTWILAAAAVVVAALLSEIPALRTVARLDLAAVVRERAG